MQKLLGPGDGILRYLEEKFSTRIMARDSSLLLEVDRNHPLVNVLDELIQLCRDKEYIDINDVDTIVRLTEVKPDERRFSPGDVILENAQTKITARTPNQLLYHRAMCDSEMVFAIGPAGTGKTFLAVAAAVAFFQKGDVERIILVRPVVEAGEKLGFLPGDIRDKVDPYFKPLYDALYYTLPPEQVKRYLDKGVFEVAPLAYMRGRTLSHAVVILDEAQNTTSMQMKMFLTRLGLHSRAIITGDLTQIDLENPDNSGLGKAKDILSGVKGISFVYLDSSDVVRHKLVSDIIRAYENHKSI